MLLQMAIRRGFMGHGMHPYVHLWIGTSELMVVGEYRREAKAHIEGQCGVCHQAFHTKDEADEWLLEYRRMKTQVECGAVVPRGSGLNDMRDLANQLPKPEPEPEPE
jgi:hypothetical protein